MENEMWIGQKLENKKDGETISERLEKKGKQVAYLLIGKNGS